MSLRWPEAITRYQGCGRLPAAFFYFRGQPGERHDAKRNGGRFGGWPRDRHQANVPDNVSQSFRARLVYDAARWMKRIFFCKHPDVFPDVTGRSPGSGQARKKVFWRGGGRGRRSFCPQKGASPSPAGKHGGRRMRRSSPAFREAEIKGEHRCSPQR